MIQPNLTTIIELLHVAAIKVDDTFICFDTVLRA